MPLSHSRQPRSVPAPAPRHRVSSNRRWTSGLRPSPYGDLNSPLRPPLPRTPPAAAHPRGVRPASLPSVADTPDTVPRGGQGQGELFLHNARRLRQRLLLWQLLPALLHLPALRTRIQPPGSDRMHPRQRHVVTPARQKLRDRQRHGGWARLVPLLRVPVLPQA